MLKMQPFRVAIVDLYNNTPNEGMRAIREILEAANGRYYGQEVTFEVFETRYKNEVPDLSFDMYISTGGPGSPFEGKGMPWEKSWFEWLEALWRHNLRNPGSRKGAIFICHSFQMMVRHFKFGDVTKRRSQSFGIFPVHMTHRGRLDPLFKDLRDPFYAADFRDWQVVHPDSARIKEMGAQVLALEKKRPHIPLERAVMAIRVSPDMVGVQFHPEADPPGMLKHFRLPERKEKVLELHGSDKYHSILHRLSAPEFLERTHQTVLPAFIKNAIERARPQLLLREEMVS